MTSNYDKSLDEIIRVKGIKNPTSMKSKHRNPNFQKKIAKKSFWKKGFYARNLDVEQKCRIKLSGLADTVTWTDLQELFSPFSQGSRINVKMHYNNTGKFLGSAEIEMPNQTLAEKAVQEYNNVDLDDLTMSAVLEIDGNPLVADSIDPKNKNKTALELNAELDQWMKAKGQSNSQGQGDDDEDKIPRKTRNNSVPKFYRQNQYAEREMASIDDLDAEIEEYMEKNGKLDDDDDGESDSD